jgi:xanthine dehydrogenase accessory factor
VFKGVEAVPAAVSGEIFDLLDQVRRSSKRAAMATLVRARGTTPRKDGTKMFVAEDGGVFGSVTIGGCVDARVIEAAGDVLAGATPRLLSLQLGDEEAWEIGLTCGGAVDVFVEPVGPELLEVYDRAYSASREGRLAAIETTIAGDGLGAHSLWDEDLPVVSNAVRERAGSTTYIEVLRPPPSLMLFGAGAVAIPLAAFAKALGFKTTVIDGRPRFANRERFPSAEVLRVGIVSEIVGQLEIGRSTAVVLTAHDYKIDGPVLERVLRTDTPYIGLLGSRKRGAAILHLLRERGVSETNLARVRVPAGLDIGGETAAEIALSIASEIVAVMHGRSGAPLGTRASV